MTSSIVPARNLLVLDIPNTSFATPTGDNRACVSFVFRDAAGQPLDADTVGALIGPVTVYRDENWNDRFDAGVDSVLTELAAPDMCRGIISLDVALPQVSAAAADAASALLDARCVELYQAVHDYAQRRGYGTGYPTYHISQQGSNTLVQAVLIAREKARLGKRGRR